MNLEQANALLKALGSKPGGHGDKWVRGSCPLAPWRHKSGKDSNPSFGLYVSPGEPARFHCFACESGSLQTLLQTLAYYQSKSPSYFKEDFHGDLNLARQIIDQEEMELAVLPEFTEFGAPEKKFEPLPEWFLDTFLRADESVRAMAYLKYRGFSEAEVNRFDLRYDTVTDRVVFPYRDVFGRLAGLRGRGVQIAGAPHFSPHHDYVWNGINNSSLVWLNEEVLDDEGPVVVVEGQFDLMRVARVYPRVIANLTAKPVRTKIKKLTQCEGVILMLDGDFAGRTATQKFLEVFDEFHIKCAVALLPIVNHAGIPVDPKDPGALKTDPDKIGEHWIRECLVGLGVDLS
jgi:5S rRNA maturation endonuclease (ribonuclease M5)